MHGTFTTNNDRQWTVGGSRFHARRLQADARPAGGGGLEIWPGNILSIPTYGTTEGWVRAHSGGAMNGLLLMVIALALPKLNLSANMQHL